MQAAQEILVNAMASDFFDDLRTKQQTGYLVQAMPINARNNLFQLFVVQSNTHDTERPSGPL